MAQELEHRRSMQATMNVRDREAPLALSDLGDASAKLQGRALLRVHSGDCDMPLPGMIPLPSALALGESQGLKASTAIEPFSMASSVVVGAQQRRFDRLWIGYHPRQKRRRVVSPVPVPCAPNTSSQFERHRSPTGEFAESLEAGLNRARARRLEKFRNQMEYLGITESRRIRPWRPNRRSDHLWNMPEYYDGIVDHWRTIEQQNSVAPNFLHRHCITELERFSAIDWLVDYSGRLGSMFPEALFMAIDLLDRFLSCVPERVSPSDLPLITGTCLFIAWKYEDSNCPGRPLRYILRACENRYSRSEIVEMEVRILRTIDFRVNKPSCINFLRRFSLCCVADEALHSIAKFYMEMAYYSASLATCPPSMVAAAAFIAAAAVTEHEAFNDDPTVAWYLGYRRSDVMVHAVYLAQFVQCFGLKYGHVLIRNAMPAVLRKYRLPSRGEVAGDMEDHEALHQFFCDHRNLLRPNPSLSNADAVFKAYVSNIEKTNPMQLYLSINQMIY